ncbi:MAG: hypothetical protein WEB88_03940 [Gemmatimonadota bacterium]
MRLRPGTALVLLLTAAQAACANVVYVNAPMGRYDELGARLEGAAGSRQRLILERPACVALLDVVVVDPARGRPPYHIFFGDYPADARQNRCFQAAVHRFPLDRSAFSQRFPPACAQGEKPRLDGCREGLARSLGQGAQWQLKLLLASDLPLDPFLIAHELNLATIDMDELGHALWQGDVALASRTIAELVADIPGSPLWSGVLRMREVR